MSDPILKKKRENWGTRMGFILAAAGFAIGLGNIWRFPYLVGENGGGAFLLIYIVMVIVIGIPLFYVEAGLGRKAQAGAISGMRKLTKKGSPWVSIGWLGVLTTLLIFSYYLMIMGWLFAYFVKVGLGTFQGVTIDQAAGIYDEFIASPWLVTGYTIIPTIILAIVVIKGLKDGTEKFVRLLMPLLILMLIALSIFSLSLPGAWEGVVWYLQPDFSQITGGTVLQALGQAFFSIGIGMAAAFTYGSYLNKTQSNLVVDGTYVISLDTLVAFISGLVIFPAIFAFQMAPDSGPGLIFLTLPSIFDQMPGGTVFGFIFFLLIIIGALTTGVGFVETLTANTSELLRLDRKKSVLLVTGVSFLLSIPSILSQGPWSNIQIFGMDIFTFIDYFSGNIMLVIGSLLLSLYVVFKWKPENFIDDINVGTKNVKIPYTVKPILTFIIPVVIAVIFITGIL
ncbi:sodium-dependent transporter [Virgibacillus kimchii]